ncbi:hypothetical protein UF64_00265 [Thalassospira sp. HJ]|uniref:hypothetical protein n=1 Tax=Thalassospira sp. HJ TaxID=1616823 RepID=UPI0005CE8775|nr:hypothetical protein [Thalassospira sp. HJ]KJE37157.1 hypothetical protein UF64_00265 [Thalassospira sp. HJ]
MKIDRKEQPRTFIVGSKKDIEISHTADITLSSDEQVTFLTENGSEFDFVRKQWGYYATPSINRRLKHFGFHTALVQNAKGHVYIFVVEAEKMDGFNAYCKAENQTVLMWLDRIICDDSHN